MGLFESLKVAGKVAICSARPDSANRIMPGVLDFVRLVTESYAPPPPTHFTVQGFHLDQGGFLLTEMAYRIPGARSTGRSYYTIGFSHEVAHLTNMLDEVGKYTIKADERVAGLHFADIWFATKPGTLKSKQIPQLDQGKAVMGKAEENELSFGQHDTLMISSLQRYFRLFWLRLHNSLVEIKSIDIQICRNVMN
uniref:Uncharacterized protein n=1 Tax=Plectus sambesii TaxID=2011161 RepID=A0A914W9R4_9BILA